MAKDILHTGEVAEILGLAPRTVRQLAKKGALPTLERLGFHFSERTEANMGALARTGYNREASQCPSRSRL